MPSNSFPCKWERPWTAIYRESGLDDGIVTGVTTFNRTNFVAHGPNIPGWRFLKAQGSDVTTALSGVRYTVQRWTPVRYSLIHKSGTYPIDYFGYGYPNAGVAVDFPVPRLSPTSKAVTEAATKLMKSYRNKTRTFSGGVFIGEIMETARLLRSPVSAAYKLTKNFGRAVEKLKNMGPKQYAKALSGAWLTYQFGVKPLMNDANDFALALGELMKGRTFDVIKCTGTGTEKWDEGHFGLNPGFSYLPNHCEAWGWLEHFSSVRFRGAVKCSMGTRTAPAIFGLSKLDIVPTVWELIPWSFLVDYFTNVGDVLDAYQLRFLNWAYLNQTIRNSSSWCLTDWTVPYEPPGQFYRAGVQGGAMRFTTRSVSRTRADPKDFGNSVTFSVPGVGSTKWLNIAALTQIISKSRP